MFIKLKDIVKKITNIKLIYIKFVRLYVYLKDIVTAEIVIYRQKKVLKKICLVARQNKRKIKIAFLVNENEKWCCQNLYDKLKTNNHFEPVILLTSLCSPDRKDLEEKNEKNIEFFSRCCDDVQMVYDNKTKEFNDLKQYNPDIVVYQQPWSIAKNQDIPSISSGSLAVYIPYCFVEEYTQLIRKHYLKFHSLLFRKYLSHNLIEQEYKNKGYKRNNLKVVGYPKLEQYANKETYKKEYIIYAPHFSVKNTTIRLGTFNQNGKFILEYAKRHPEFNWVFKPHPRCKQTFLEEKLFKNMEEVNSYYNEWAKIGMVYDKGNYIDLFKKTKCLITDCASFLIEFLPAESPVINLKRKDSVYISDITEEIARSYYQVYNINELNNVFHDVLEKNIDIKKQERLELIKKLNLVTNASDNIIEDLEKTFYGN